MHELRRSERVQFPGWNDHVLAGILDQPIEEPKGYCIFSHCFTCNKDLKAIVRISRRLAEHGWGVLRFDFSGLGDSQGDFSQSNFSTNCIDLRAAIRFLAQQRRPPLALIGHSFGGAASLRCAEELESIRGVTCIASPSDTHHLAVLLERKNPNIVEIGRGQVSIGGRNYWITRDMLEDFREHDLPAAISRLTKQVLIFHSLVDETLGYEHALRIFSLVTNRRDDLPPSRGASLITLPNADHLFTQSQSDLPYISDIIHLWLRRLTSVEN